MLQKVRGPRELSETLPTSVMPLAKIVEDSIEESIFSINALAVN